MRKKAAVFVMLNLVFITVLIQARETIEHSKKFRIAAGFQRITWNCWGGSIRVDFPAPFSLQGLIGLVGDRQAYAFRGMFRVFEQGQLNIYGYGLLGAETVGEIEPSGNYIFHIEETGLLLGSGAGIEYDVGKKFLGTISVTINGEVGIENLSGYKEIDANYFTITMALGIHIYILNI